MLAREYIRLALKNKEYFRYILAMTFTNKSTQEMKDRILHYLDDFSKGRSEDLAAEIIEELRKEGTELSLANLKVRSQEILVLLLHRYSEFSISTIDAFFQRVIRSFTRETGLLGNFRLEVENGLVLEEVISLLMDQLAQDEQLRNWVLDFSMEKLTDGKNWDVRSALQDFAKLTEKEDFKAIEDSIIEVTSDRDFFKSFRAELSRFKYSFEAQVFDKAKTLLKEIQEQQLTADDFAGKSTGIYSYITKLSNEIIQPSPTVVEIVGDASKWPHKKSSSFDVVSSLAQKRWQPQLHSLVQLIEENLAVYNSVEEVLKNLYSFGLLADIVKTQKEYLAAENMMLLSDSPKFLNKLMQEQDASFIFEKVGSFYRHYLLDEFQDTSGLQWKNLLPLIQNGLAQNYKSLIVGDIKQSIYRWRGGDLSILQEKVKSDVSVLLTQTHSLDKNFRSDHNIVSFNNALFESASKILSDHTQTTFPSEAYQDASQKIFNESSIGFVRIQVLAPTEKEDTFREEALALLPKLFDELQEKGVAVKDIAFLVRDNKDGRLIADRFMEYRTSPDRNKDNKYDVVSSESLQLDRSTSVVILINALKVLDNPADQIAKAHLAYEYQKLWPTQAFSDLNEIFSSAKGKSFWSWVPTSFGQQQNRLASLSLFELVENLIHIFNLGKLSTEVIYIQSFQDLVLEFSQREKNDLSSFLEWWEVNKQKKSIQVSGDVDAAQIITIHKSKGLQFKYVIIPFLDWDLGHGSKGPILWCKSDHPLFKKAGYVPIKYKRDLEKTLFKNDYREENKRIYLDNLNLLYVAFTRAETGLIAFCPKSKLDKLGNVSTLVSKVLEANPILQAYWSAETRLFQMGEVSASTKKKELTNTVPLTNYLITPWRERLQVRSSGMEFFEPTQQRKKINFGIFVHGILSKVRIAGDVVVAIENVFRSGELSGAEIIEVSELIQWVVNYPQLEACFSSLSVCKMEAVLFTTDGAERRIDRVATQGNRTWVLDYKTGVATAKDEEQVKDYMKLLKAMGKQEVVGYLAYVHEKRCVEVKI